MTNQLATSAARTIKKKGTQFKDAFETYSKVILVIVALLFFWVGQLNIGWETKKLLFIGLGALLIITTLVVCAIFFRTYHRVAVVTDFFLLLILVCLSSVGPALFLGKEFQILLLKFAAILFFSLLPGLLYLQFIVVRGKTLREEYVLNLFRLHVDDYGNLPEPPRGSIFHEYWRECWEMRGGIEAAPPARENLYLIKFEGLYGEAITRRLIDDDRDGNRTTRFRGENLLPVISTTLLLSVCWAMVLQPEAVFSWSRLPGTFALNNRPLVPAEALRFGFVGAYFFILQMLVRRYFQDDLKTSAYINALNRIILVILLVTAINIVWPANWPLQQQYAFAFMLGIFPQIGVRALHSLITLPLKLLIPSLKTDYPLSDLDGLNIWYESRLLEESIEDMQNLAKANLVDVILRTRIPVDRLVDWIDQAHLYLHVPKKDRIELRRRGIRTATGLERHVKKHIRVQKPFEAKVDAKENGHNEEAQPPMKEDRAAPQPTVTNQELDSIANILANEPNLYHVREWKDFPWVLEKMKAELHAAQQQQGRQKERPRFFTPAAQEAPVVQAGLE